MCDVPGIPAGCCGSLAAAKSSMNFLRPMDVGWSRRLPADGRALPFPMYSPSR